MFSLFFLQFVMLKHLLARVACLIVLPLFIYFFFFYIHLVVLKYPGPGSPMMSTRFRHSLDVAAGKQVDMFAGGFSPPSSFPLFRGHC